MLFFCGVFIGFIAGSAVMAIAMENKMLKDVEGEKK